RGLSEDGRGCGQQKKNNAHDGIVPGIGGWGLGVGFAELTSPNIRRDHSSVVQSPIPNPQSPVPRQRFVASHNVLAPPPIAAPMSAPFFPPKIAPSPAPLAVDPPMTSTVFFQSRPLARSTR